MCDYIVSVAYEDITMEDLIITSKYEKALIVYKEAKKRKPYFISLSIKCGDKLVSIKNKWFKKRKVVDD